MIITPINPTTIAAMRLRPIGSLKKMAAARAMESGVACKSALLPMFCVRACYALTKHETRRNSRPMKVE